MSEFVFNISLTAKDILRRGHSFVSSQTGRAGDRTLDLWVQGEWLINYTAGAPDRISQADVTHFIARDIPSIKFKVRSC